MSQQKFPPGWDERRVRACALVAAGLIVVALVSFFALATLLQRSPDTTPSTLWEQGNLKYEDHAKYVRARLETLDNLLFEYDIVRVDVSMYPPFGPDVNVDLETTNEVAKQVTEDDLRKFWNQIAPILILPDRHPRSNQRVGLKLYTPVPGAAPWAVITRFKDDGEYKVKISINEYGIDAEPYYFVDEIDRSLPNQGYMIVTLPVVNRIVEELIRHGWEVESRKEDFVCLEMKKGVGSHSVTLDPEGIDIDVYHASGNDFPNIVEIVFSELGLANDVKRKLHTVIGSPEYMRVGQGKPASWTWKFGQIRVKYRRLPDWDQLSAVYAQQD